MVCNYSLRRVLLKIVASTVDQAYGGVNRTILQMHGNGDDEFSLGLIFLLIGRQFDCCFTMTTDSSSFAVNHQYLNNSTTSAHTRNLSVSFWQSALHQCDNIGIVCFILLCTCSVAISGCGSRVIILEESWEDSRGSCQ